MGCSSCGTNKDGKPAGCKSNGNCGSGGCGIKNSYNWLLDIDQPGESKYDIVEVKFKGGRKEFFRNTKKLELVTGDWVVVASQPGFHIGQLSLQGELVKLQMRKKKVSESQEIAKILRKPTQKDFEKFQEYQNREVSVLYRTKVIAEGLKLKMKLSDVEFQADGAKATFYYSADERVDFRELIKVLAKEFKTRVDMRQISLRHEAGRLGGIGSCGRTLCCSTWLSDFKPVTTDSARYQNLSLNPLKLSGQCGRLKCCLNYELDTYLDALIDIPTVKRPLLTEKGEAKLFKVDIFKKILWFSYPGEAKIYQVSAKRVNEILDLNKKGKKPFSLEENREEAIKKENVLLEGFEHKNKKKRNNSSNSKKQRNKRSKNQNQKDRRKPKS